jgi:hypothetical protein
MTPASVIVHCEQGSAAWREARCGMITASRCIDLLSTIKKGKEEGAPRRNYRADLIAEILTGVPTADPYVSREMQWGIDQEPFGRAAYEMEFDVMVETVGFVSHPDIARFGASPDGFVGDDGLVQIKCPATTTHLAWILEGKIPLEHAPQLLAELSCCPDRQWNDFVSFDPRVPKHLQLFVRRFHRNNAMIEKLETAVVQFNAEIEYVLAQLPQARTGADIVSILDYMPKDEMEF